MTSQRRWTSVASLLVVAAATGLWSCGGLLEGPTSPVALPLPEGSAPAAAVPGEGDDGGVTASAADNITICHKGSDKQIPPSALGGHLGHGDRLGTCAPTAAACPCFTSAGIDQVAAQCSSGSLFTDCTQLYSISMFCVGSGSGANLGAFMAVLGSNSCSTQLRDSTGSYPEITLPVSPAEYEACKEAIIGASAYPATCPR